MKKLPIIIVCMLVLVCLGLIYGYSIFVSPLEAEFGWSRSDTSLTFTISMIAMCVGALISGRFNSKKNKPFYTMIISAVCVCVGFIASSNLTSLIVFYIAYGGGVGFGVGFAYSQIINLGAKLIPGRQGLLSGLLMMCFGFGTLILGSICNVVMESIGWRTTFLGLGIVFGVLLVLVGLCLQVAYKSIDNQPADTTNITNEGMTTSEMMKTSSFKLVFIWIVLLSSAGLAFVGHVMPCAVELGASTSLAVLLTGVTSVSNGAGRFIFGIVYDKIGVRNTMSIITVLFVVASVVACFAVYLGILPLFILGCVLVGLSFGASPISTSIIFAKLYGLKYFSGNFGVAMMNLVFAAFLGPYLIGYVYTAMDSYTMTFFSLIAFAIVQVLIIIPITKILKKDNALKAA